MGWRGEEVTLQGGGRRPGGGLVAVTPEPTEGAALRAPCTRAPPDGASRVRHIFHFSVRFNNPYFALPGSPGLGWIVGGYCCVHFSAKETGAQRDHTPMHGKSQVPTQAFIYSTVKKPLPTVCWGLGILPYIRPTGPWRPGGLQSR